MATTSIEFDQDNRHYIIQKEFLPSYNEIKSITVQQFFCLQGEVFNLAIAASSDEQDDTPSYQKISWETNVLYYHLVTIVFNIEPNNDYPNGIATIVYGMDLTEDGNYYDSSIWRGFTGNHELLGTILPIYTRYLDYSEVILAPFAEAPSEIEIGTEREQIPIFEDVFPNQNNESIVQLYSY